MAYGPCKRAHKLWQALQKGKPCRRAVASPAEGQKGFPAKMGSRMWMSSHPSIQESHFLNSLSWISAMRPKSPYQSDDWTTKQVEDGWIELVDSVRLPCMHNPFHLQCIQQPLAEHQFCPACRFPIDPEFKTATLQASQRMKEYENNGLPHVFRRALVKPKAQPKRKPGQVCPHPV